MHTIIISFSFILSVFLLFLAFNKNSEISFICGLVLLPATALISTVVYFPINEIYLDAESVKVGDELIVKADNHPSKSVTDIKYLDKELQLVVITNQNFWKSESITYEIKIKEKQ